MLFRSELVVALTIGIVVLVPVLGESLGWLLGRRLAPRSTRRAKADRVVGAVAGLAGVCAVFWVLVPVARASSGWTRPRCRQTSHKKSSPARRSCCPTCPALSAWS